MKTLEDILYPVLREFLSKTRVASPELGPETPLIGPTAPFDSLGLVTFIVSVEQKIADDRGVALTLLSGDAIARNQFRTLGSLADYLDELLPPEQQRAGE